MSKADVPVAVGIPIKRDPDVKRWNDCGNCGCTEDGLCGCSNDLCTCLSVCCCPCITSAQMYDRVVKPGSCMTFFCIFVGLTVAASLLNSMHVSTVAVSTTIYGGTTIYSSQPTIYGGMADMVQLAYVILMVYLVMSVRRVLREKDGLEATCCCGLEDCCCSYLMNPCTQCLLLRKMGLGGGKYSITSPNGGSQGAEAAPLRESLTQP